MSCVPVYSMTTVVLSAGQVYWDNLQEPNNQNSRSGNQLTNPSTSMIRDHSRQQDYFIKEECFRMLSKANNKFELRIAFHQDPAGLWRPIVVFKKCLSTIVDKINSGQQCSTVYRELSIQRVVMDFLVSLVQMTKHKFIIYMLSFKYVDTHNSIVYSI